MGETQKESSFMTVSPGVFLHKCVVEGGANILTSFVVVFECCVCTVIHCNTLPW